MIVWTFEDDLGVCQVRVSQRGKTQIKLRVPDSHTVTISAPKQVSTKRIQAFLAEHQAWIRSQRQGLANCEQTQSLWFLGQHLPIELQPNTPSPVLTEQYCHVPAHNQQSHLALYQLLQQHAATLLLPRLRDKLLPAQQHLDTRLAHVSSYWGICRSKQIKLNWRLIGAPIAVQDSVCWHEICHLQHPNHSTAFWQAVAQADPNYRNANAWLKQHGKALMAVDDLKKQWL